MPTISHFSTRDSEFKVDHPGDGFYYIEKTKDLTGKNPKSVGNKVKMKKLELPVIAARPLVFINEADGKQVEMKGILRVW